MAARQVHGVRQRFAASAAGYHTLRAIGSRLPRLTGGWVPWLGLDRFDAPELPGLDWVRLRPTLSGICGSDIALLTGKGSAVLSPFVSMPAVLGHETIAVVDEVGPAVRGMGPGQRVALDPLLGCAVRGLEWCASCAAGHPGLCLRTADGQIAPAPMIGFCRDLPGAWSEEMVAHVSQLHPLPDALSDEQGVMIEPFSVALHAVLAEPPSAGQQVLVIGGGTLGLCTLAALRMVAPDAEVTIVTRHDVQARMAERLGAGAVARGAVGAIDAAVAHAGARRHRPIVGGDVLTGGFEQVYDAVGTGHSLDAALRVTGPRGRLAIVGGPAEIHDLDWTLAWTRELRIEGSYVYGTEHGLPGAPHTFDAAIRLLRDHPELPIGELVTHRYRLSQWRSAMATALDRGSAGALKIVFTPQAG
jgi:threonine dehydrogenase-like Zn-dependent dehydrogenase